MTGASSGLGLELATQLARDHGANLVLVARRRERLEALALELSSKYAVSVRVIAADMTSAADVDRVVHESTADGELYGAILNAGVTYFGHALELRDDALEAMVATNLTSTVKLTNAIAKDFLARGTHGALMIVSSVGGVAPLPFQAAYAASKAFLNSYTQALAEELRGKPLSITLFVPGGIATEMTITSGITAASDSLEKFLMPVDACAKSAIDGFVRRKRVHVPGVLYKIAALVTRVAPQGIVARQSANVYRGSLTKG